jgi:hypothetical protein
MHHRELKMSAPTLAIYKWDDGCLVQSHQNPGAGTMAEGVDPSQWKSGTNKEHDA